MQHYRKLIRIAAGLMAATFAAFAARPPDPKPGLNFFSKEQDIQLGREAAGQIRQQRAIVSKRDLEDYCNRIAARLANSRAADGKSYPYRVQVVYEKSINAFALPGGPMFVHTGLIGAIQNEPQMAAVLAHEMSHVALRHGTSQMSKANLIQIPAMIAAGMLSNGTVLGQLKALGVRALAGSVLLSYSRTAESEADLNGARMMYDAGYDPHEMARFFEKLEAQGGKAGPFAEFLSDHPNPANRVANVEQFNKYFPQRSYDNGNPADLARMKKIVASLPPMRKPRMLSDRDGGQGTGAPPVSAGPAPAPAQARVSSDFRTYQAQGFEIGYPRDWKVSESKGKITFAPAQATFESSNGTAFGYGAQASLFQTSGRADLHADTERLVKQLVMTGLRRDGGAGRSLRVDGNEALLTLLHSQSPYQGEEERDVLLTVARPEGIFYMVFFAPKSLYSTIEPAFERMTQSIEFH